MQNLVEKSISQNYLLVEQHLGKNSKETEVTRHCAGKFVYKAMVRGPFDQRYTQLEKFQIFNLPYSKRGENWVRVGTAKHLWIDRMDGGAML